MKQRCTGKPISVRLTPQMREDLERLAEQEGRPLSNMMKAVLDRYIQEWKKENLTEAERKAA